MTDTGPFHRKEDVQAIASYAAVEISLVFTYTEPRFAKFCISAHACVIGHMPDRHPVTEQRSAASQKVSKEAPTLHSMTA